MKEGYNPLRVDEAMVRFGMNHGPLEHLDLIGLDISQPALAQLCLRNKISLP